MNSHSPRLRLPRPCEEAWEGMQPSENGRFCAVCTTEIVDFTAMEEAEIIAYLQEHKDRKICGRFDAKQIQTPEEWQFGGILRAFRWTLTMAGFLLFAAAAQAQSPVQARLETEKADSVFVQITDDMSYRTLSRLVSLRHQVKVYAKGKRVMNTTANRLDAFYIQHEHFQAGEGWVKVVIPRNEYYKRGVFHIHKNDDIKGGEVEIAIKRRKPICIPNPFRRRHVMGTPTF